MLIQTCYSIVYLSNFVSKFVFFSFQNVNIKLTFPLFYKIKQNLGDNKIHLGHEIRYSNECRIFENAILT